MKRVLITGAAGMLGSELLRRVPHGIHALGTDLVQRDGLDVPGLDLADGAAVDAAWRAHGPFDGVIHGAAWTAVDLAEEKPAEAARANTEACRVLARQCATVGARLVVVSTDFVFDGRASQPYVEGAPENPLSVYGRTKRDGELAALAEHPDATMVVRTQWLYGPRGKHFPRTIAGFARSKKQLKVVHDQVGAPTSTLELAPALWDVLARGETGLYHAACEGACSWFELTREIVARLGLADVELTPCTTADFPRPAARPAYSVLDSTKLARLRGRPMADWRRALADYLVCEKL